MKDDDDEDQADGGLHQVEANPALLHEQHVADEHADAGHGELCQHGHRHRGALAAHMETRFHPLFVGLNVLLELAREEFAHLGVEAIDIGDQRQQAEQNQQQDG